MQDDEESQRILEALKGWRVEITRNRPGRPRNITLGELARFGLGIPAPLRRPPGRPSKPVEVAQAIIDTVEEIKRQYRLSTDKAAITKLVKEFAKRLGGRPPQWQTLKIKTWQSSLSRARYRVRRG